MIKRRIGLGDMTAVILAGGLGTRLRSVVADRPKVLAEVKGRPFLCYLLDQLTCAGLRDIVMATGYFAGAVSEVLGTHYREAELHYSVETEPLGTGGALRLSLPFLASDTVLVLNGDSYCALDFAAFASSHDTRGAALSLALAEVADVTRYGAVEIEKDGSIASFMEKGRRAGRGLINAGIYLVSRRIIAGIPQGKAVSLEREVFPEMVGNGVYGFPTTGKFIDIGIPEDYRAAEKFFDDPTDSVGR